MTTMTTTTPKNMGRVTECLPQSQHAVFVERLAIATRIAGHWRKIPRSDQLTFRQPTQFSLFTEEQVSVMMDKVMASMKEKYGGKKKPKRQVQFSREPSDSGRDSDSDSSHKK
jgi:hypothetical protein